MTDERELDEARAVELPELIAPPAPASTPRVTRSPLIGGNTILLVAGHVYADGLRRLVVSMSCSDARMAQLEAALVSRDDRIAG